MYSKVKKVLNTSNDLLIFYKNCYMNLLPKGHTEPEHVLDGHCWCEPRIGTVKSSNTPDDRYKS